MVCDRLKATFMPVYASGYLCCTSHPFSSLVNGAGVSRTLWERDQWWGFHLPIFFFFFTHFGVLHQKMVTETETFCNLYFVIILQLCYGALLPPSAENTGVVYLSSSRLMEKYFICISFATSQKVRFTL